MNEPEPGPEPEREVVMPFDHEKLDVYQAAIDFMERILERIAQN